MLQPWAKVSSANRSSEKSHGCQQWVPYADVVLSISEPALKRAELCLWQYVMSVTWVTPVMSGDR